jgi:hypothetical protein
VKGYNEGWRNFKHVFGETLDEYIENTTLARSKKEIQQFTFYLSHHNEINQQVKKLFDFIGSHPILSEKTEIVWDNSGRKEAIKVYKDGFGYYPYDSLGEAVDSSLKENGRIFLFYIGLTKKDSVKVAGDIRKSVLWIEKKKKLMTDWRKGFNSIRTELMTEKLDYYRDMRDLYENFKENRFLKEKERTETELKKLSIL